VRRKVCYRTLFDLYPGNPSKQAGKVAGAAGGHAQGWVL